MSNRQQDELISLLKQAMQAWRLTQSEVARRLGVTQAYVSLLLKGERSVTHAVRDQVSKMLYQEASSRAEDNAGAKGDALSQELWRFWDKEREERARQEREFNEQVGQVLGNSPSQTLSRTALLGAYGYLSLHHSALAQGEYTGLDPVGEMAGERIRHQIDAITKADMSSEQLCRALGIYIARLELCLAADEQRIAELEKELNRKRSQRKK